MDNWTLQAYTIYVEAMRKADKALHDERDRRYAEVAIEKEKALKIKEVADLTALELARQIQTYKDEQHNGLLAAHEKDRATYATHADLVAAVEKIEVQLQPIRQYVALNTGRSNGISASWTVLLGFLGAIATILVIFAAFAGGI